MLMADEDDNYVPVKVAGDEGLKLFGFETVDFEKELLDSVSIVEQVEAKLSTIIGNLWKLMEARHPLFQTGQFDATALARLVESPWVDIGIRSWFLRDEEGLWTQQYGLFHCSFE
ncbi:hypothetical protein FS842_004008 [Serendipita sp. 407]|nr:hypothetical protein FS842_004008 [Serendipita sp. 407]